MQISGHISEGSAAAGCNIKSEDSHRGPFKPRLCTRVIYLSFSHSLYRFYRIVSTFNQPETMKWCLGAVLALLCFVAILSASPFPDLCRYKGRQMTIGQTITSCYANVTCHPRGLLEISDPCPHAICTKPSDLIGYRRFDDRKPYPDCCATPLCRDGRVTIQYNTVSRTFRPKTFMKRSPHVMGIKFP